MRRRDFIGRTALGAGLLVAEGFAQSRPVLRRRYRVAVIGRTGRGDYGHGIDVVWKDIDQAELVAVADEDPAGRAAAARRLGVPRAYADYREMLERERPDIVSVAPRWLDGHRDMVVACAEAGSHVFLEKPMCRTLAEADEMIAAMERRGLKLAIAHQNRYSPTLERVQEILAEGRLGDLLELRGRGKEDHRGGGEDLMVLGTHIMDLMRLLAGDPQWCLARVLEDRQPVTRRHVREGAEGIGPLAGDEIHAMYGLPGKVTGYFSTLRARHGASARFGLHVYGTKGVLAITAGSLLAWYLDDPSWLPGQGGRGWVPVTSAGIGRPEPLKNERVGSLGNRRIALDLIRAIETDTQPRGSAYDGRWALEMIMAVYESHRLGGPVALPLKNRRHPLELL